MVVSKEEVKRIARDMGLEYIETEEGNLIIQTRSPIKRPIVHEYHEYDTTPLWRKMKPDLIAKYRRKREILRQKGYAGIEGLFRVVCTKYIDPKISFDIIPTKVKNVTFYFPSCKISGDIEVELTNKGEDGKEGHCIVRRLYYWRHGCPEEDEAYDWKDVIGSADILPNWDHSFTEDETDTFLATVRKELSNKVRKNERIEVSASWETSGLGNVARTLLQIFLRGNVRLRNGFDLTIKYEFPEGNTKTINRHVDVKVTLPVEGGVQTAWG